jgi:hypothetical protein
MRDWRQILSWKQSFSIGSRVEVIQAIEILNIFIPLGERGTIVDVEDDGIIVKFDAHGVPSDWANFGLGEIEEPREDGFWVMLEDVRAL